MKQLGEETKLELGDNLCMELLILRPLKVIIASQQYK